MQLLLLCHFLSLVLTPAINEAEWHDIHLSKCSISWLESEQSVRIQLHIYRDDLTLALDAFSKGLTTERESYKSDSFLIQYLESKLRIEINQREVKPMWVKKWNTEDELAVLIHFEVRNIDYIHDILVGYDALMEIYSDQRNIVDIKGPEGKRAYLLFSERGEEETMSFK